MLIKFDFPKGNQRVIIPRLINYVEKNTNTEKHFKSKLLSVQLPQFLCTANFCFNLYLFDFIRA